MSYLSWRDGRDTEAHMKEFIEAAPKEVNDALDAAWEEHELPDRINDFDVKTDSPLVPSDEEAAQIARQLAQTMGLTVDELASMARHTTVHHVGTIHQILHGPVGQAIIQTRQANEQDKPQQQL